MSVVINGSGTITGVPGAILQVKQTVKTDGFSLAGGSWADVTGFTVSITPSASTSKILVMFSAYGTQQGVSGTYGIQLRLVRNSTNIYVGDASGSANQASAGSVGTTAANYAHSLNGSFLDSPATTSATTYKIQMYVESGVTGFLGGSYGTAAAYNARVPSQILVMEVAA